MDTNSNVCAICPKKGVGVGVLPEDTVLRESPLAYSGKNLEQRNEAETGSRQMCYMDIETGVPAGWKDGEGELPGANF